MGRTMFYSLEGPINAIGINRDSSHVVVGGRNVFKVLSIEDDEFVEKTNLRVGKHINLNYSASDVTWNPIEDHILASAATNGAVVVWNLNRTSRSKQECVFLEHKRTVNRVCFHSNESQLLLSGSQDGFMKLFDLRRKEVQTTFSGQSESVRDVQFSPHQYFTFAAAYENGNIQVWDMRRPDHWERQFTAHNGPVFTIDWHPEDKHWLGSAGRDRTIKVWDMSHSKSKCTHTVQTIASVARIKWRPQRKYHIASCALLVDFNINIWDVRRPYIPFAAFSEHKDVTTGIVWSHDPHTFLSSSKDCTLYQHIFRDANRPADQAIPVGIDMNINGDISHACSDKLLGISGSKGGSTNYSSTKLPSFFRKNPDRSEQFTVVSSSLFMLDTHNLNEGLSTDWLVESAKRYQLSGKSLEELCDHNAAVAKDLERHQIAQVWNMLKLLYTTNMATPSQTRTTSVLGPGTEISTKGLPKGGDTDRVKQNLDGSHLHLLDIRSVETDSKDKHVDTSTGLSDDSSDNESETERNLANIASGLTTQAADFFFGDREDTNPFEFDDMGNMENPQDWNLPNEAFQPRHEIVAGSVSPENAGVNQTGPDSPSSVNESEFSVSTNFNIVESNKEDVMSVPSFLTQLPLWQFTELVVDMLHYCAEQGDVQMSVSVLVILGDRIRQHIDQQVQEQWLMSYIDLLSRFRLWTVATQVIKLCNLANVGMLNQQSTTIHTNCDKCGKALLKSGWTCDRCKKLTNTCSICHHPVKGLYVWCQGCSHGGHLAHIQDWLKDHKYCPTGCGHICEYT